MKIKFYNFSYIIASLLVLLSILDKELIKTSDAQVSLQRRTDFSLNVIPGTALEFAGGINARGKRTFLTNNVINFGTVSFIRPELITNGDAYLDNKYRLNVEATLVLRLILGGYESGKLTISKNRGSPNPFSDLFYSLGINREDALIRIFEYPQRDTIKEITKSGEDVTIRIIARILPNQRGFLSDTFNIEGQVQ